MECRQTENESFEKFQQRFQSLLDEPLPDSWDVYFFLRNLFHTYRKQIQGESQYATYKVLTTSQAGQSRH